MKPMNTKAGRQQVFSVSSLGSHWLMARDTGARACRSLEEQLRSATADDDVVVDFDGVEAITFSFADEFVGRFMALRDAGALPQVGVVLTHLNEDIRETIALVLERRNLVAIERQGADGSLLGADRHLEETFTTALLLHEFKAAEIAERLGISPQNANNRLKRLTAAGAVKRVRTNAERGGKEFAYQAVT